MCGIYSVQKRQKLNYALFMLQGLGSDMVGAVANEICRRTAHMVADLRTRKQ